MQAYVAAVAAEALDARRRKRPRSRSAALAERAVGKIKETLRRRRDYERLLELPDYLLDDVGLTREQIAEEMRRPFF